MASSTSSSRSASASEVGRGLGATLVALLLLAGCATGPERGSAGPRPGAAELADVPFFPQAQYQCGPAALATVLGYSGIPATPESLASRIYLPGRRGSLQLELVAAARQLERVPYALDPTLEAIRREVRAGRPVLVLQNLGLRSIPRWHYAVVVGEDPAAREIILRSGVKPRLVVSERRFLASWRRADHWALVVLRPGELPENPDPVRLTAAAAALESVGRLESARDTFLALTRGWPDDATAWFGLGNAQYRLGARAAAESAYRRALEREPAHAAALNNLAQVMSDRGCPAEARSLLARARAAAHSDGLAEAIAETTSAVASAVPSGSVSCEPAGAAP